MVMGKRTGTTIKATRIAAPHPQRGLRGTISAENANTWTIVAANGTSYTVTISPTTAIGTRKSPASAQSFPVGSHVMVMGKRTGTTINAARIAAPAKLDRAGAAGGAASNSHTPAG
jgi:hypothetical protein